MSDETTNVPVFEKMSAEQKRDRLEALSVDVKAILQMLINADIQAGGEVTEGTLEAVAPCKATCIWMDA